MPRPSRASEARKETVSLRDWVERARVDETVGREAEKGAGRRNVHGATVAKNALLQRAGEEIGFVTTEGFRDLLLIGRQNRPELYALKVRRARPLVLEENCFTVRERIA